MNQNKYSGDMIIIERFSEFLFDEGWNKGTKIALDDVTCGIHTAIPEQSEEYGNNTDRPAAYKDNDWHIGRVIYFINHPEEIKDIQIDNLCNGNHIYPIPIIEDGNHRFMAALWLYDQGLMKRVHCLYGGRQDVLDYLIGVSNICPTE